MSCYSDKKIFKLAEAKDLDFITGGATVVKSIENNLMETSYTQKCNCNLFKPSVPGVALDICDNCAWSQAPYSGSKITYCSKQKK